METVGGAEERKRGGGEGGFTQSLLFTLYENIYSCCRDRHTEMQLAERNISRRGVNEHQSTPELRLKTETNSYSFVCFSQFFQLLNCSNNLVIHILQITDLINPSHHALELINCPLILKVPCAGFL